jgi:Tfp pilus assembly protein PilN
MSVRINLLPDHKQAKIRAARSRQVAAALGTLIISLSLGTVLVLAIISGAQQLRINGLQNDIEEAKGELASIDGLEEAVTAQLHLESLNNLYQTRTHMTQMFKVMETVAPVRDFGLTQLSLEGGQVTLIGRARTMQIIDKFTKALAAHNVELGQRASKSNEPHFTAVELQEAVVGDSDGRVVFTIVATMSDQVVQPPRAGGDNGR